LGRLVGVDSLRSVNCQSLIAGYTSDLS
jgi:hypothetical protein